MITSTLPSLAEPLLENDTISNGDNTHPTSPDNTPITDEHNADSVSSRSTNTNRETDNTNRPKHTPSCWYGLAVLIAILPTLLFGINTGILNAPESVIFSDHTVWQWSLAVSAFCAGGLIGAVTSGPLSDRYGRRRCLFGILVANAVFGALHVLAPSIYVLVVARLGVGVAGGGATVVTPLYLAETAPRGWAGTIGMLTQVSVVVGILLSVLWAVPFCTEDRWRIVFLPLPVVSVMGIVLEHLGLLPESPVWLLLHTEESTGQDARDVIRLFRKGMVAHEDVEAEVHLLIADTGTTASAAEEESLFEYVWKPHNRIPVLSAVLFPVAQQLSGINAVFYYSTLFFDGVIPNPQTGTIVAFLVNVAATILALLLIDRFRRKTLLAWSAGGMCISCVPLTLSLHRYLPPAATITGVIAYITFFELGLGSIPYFLAPELVAPQFVGRVQSIAMAVNWIMNFGVALLFPLLSSALGPYAFVPFGVVLGVMTLYAVCILPDHGVVEVVEAVEGEDSLDRIPSTTMV